MPTKFLSVSFKNQYISCKINDMLLLETSVSEGLLRILHIMVPFLKLNLKICIIFTLQITTGIYKLSFIKHFLMYKWCVFL